MPPAASARRPGAPAAGLIIAILTSLGLLALPAVFSAAAAAPDLARGSAYLVAPANLTDGHFYESFPGFADFGLTLDGAFALAATGDENPALQGIVTFFNDNGKDPHGNTASTWTGIGTRFASGGSIAKEALLSEVAGDNPRDFGGHDLIAALNASVCARPSRGGNTSCAGPGNYTYATSVFSQALGIIAQLRAGQASSAAAPVAYLESLRNSDGSFPSLIPDSGDHDVDSTAAAAMALALVPAAATDVGSGLAWIARQQEQDGGFPGAGGDSVNSAGLAIQALTLQAARYQRQITAALGFLAAEQNGDGGFNPDARGQHGSNVRASAQALGGAAGTSFAVLRRNLSGTPTPTPTPTRTASRRPATPPAPTPTAAVPLAAASSPGPAATPRGAPAPLPHSSSIFPNGAAHPAAHARFADASSAGSVAAGLWWAALAVAVAAALVIALLLRRRRRLYPAAARGRRASPAGKASP